MTTTKPQDRKPRAPKGRKDGTDFVYTINGKSVRLPLLEHIKFGVARRLRKLKDDAEVLYSLVEELADEKSLAIIDELTQRETAQLMEEYYRVSGVDLGESSASAS